MPVDPRTTISGSDDNKKLAWFKDDFYGFLYTGLTIFLVLGVTIAGSYLLASVLKYEVIVIAIVIVSAVIAFLLVFIFQINVTVIGKRRQFRYFCNWL